MEPCSSEVLPDIEKHKILRYYFTKYNLKIFVETGTYIGSTVKAMSTFAEKIYSIELNNILYKKAVRRFRGSDNINIIHGDSIYKLKELIPIIDKPTLFWLDAHYSGIKTAYGVKKTPIVEEIESIFSVKYLNHVIMIDDIRYFGFDRNYPRVKNLIKIIESNNKNVSIVIKNDIMVITPNGK